MSRLTFSSYLKLLMSLISFFDLFGRPLSAGSSIANEPLFVKILCESSLFVSCCRLFRIDSCIVGESIYYNITIL
jgi:hypothetical protein